MPQVKKKKSTKTTKKATCASKTHKKTCCRTACKKGKGVSTAERMHVYIVTALAIAAGVLLCMDAAILSIA